MSVSYWLFYNKTLNQTPALSMDTAQVRLCKKFKKMKFGYLSEVVVLIVQCIPVSDFSLGSYLQVPILNLIKDCK